MSYPTAQSTSSRRSRSRSPRSYGSRAMHFDGGHADYRDYPYERERYGYDRDRSNDYGRRGRSRSPTFDDGGSRKRRRSPSPYERDRYEPRPRYNDDYDGYSRGSPPRRGGHPPPYGRRAPPDPHTLDYPASLKQYAEWFRFFYPQQALEEDNADKAAEQEAGDGSKPRNGIRSKWEKYKKEFAAQQLQTMFDHHKKSPWFWEKYDPAPEFQKLRTRVRKEGWKGRLSIFLHDLESGKFDPDMHENDGEPPASPTKEVGGDTSMLDTNEETKAAGDDDMQYNLEADEEEPVRETNGKAKDTNRTNRGEEFAVPTEGNQVMIRTIPPDIGRLKLEESCKIIPGYVYLALGDPLQKRNYYRAGWIRFADDADMGVVMNELQDRKIEGFKLHVTHNTKPFVNKIRFAPEVASRPERMEKDLVNAKTLAGLLEEEAVQLRKAKMSELELAKAEGDEAPMEDVNAENTEQDEEDPPERGSEAVERRIEKVMAELRDQGVVDLDDETAYENKKVEISLDLYIAYLRAAFHCCYYCCFVTDHVEELQRKCIKHVRKPLSKPTADETKGERAGSKKEEDGEEKPVEKETKKGGDGRKNQTGETSDERWLEWLDSKIALLINRDGVDPRDYGGKNYDEELTKVLEPHIKQEDEGKYRCKVHLCQKLFKAGSFVEKHIANKHPELIKSLDDLQYFNNFALDPHRIQPFAHVPPPVGNSTQAPPQAYGLQGPVLGGDYGRFGTYPPLAAYPIPPPPAGYWDYSGRGFYPDAFGMPQQQLQRREESNPRRLSERISGFVMTDIPATAGLPAKPPPPSLDAALSAGSGGGAGGGGGGGGGGRKRGNQNNNGPPPPPPPDAKEDPRAAAGRKISYHDMDLVAELPSLRLPATPGDGEHLVQDGVVLPPFNKFSIDYPSQGEAGRPIPTPPSSDRPALSSSDSGETDSSGDEESGHEMETDNFDSTHSPTIPRLRPAIHGPTGSSPPSHPRFSRAFSAPLPSQLGHLQHPHKPSSLPKLPTKPPMFAADTTEVSQFRELSLELADSVQMVIQTMLQVSPSQILEPAKEQFSACALSVPTPSMSAMLTAMKNLNYISANMNTFCSEVLDSDGDDVPALFSSRRHNDFDIGELLQSTGDALSGTASHTGVDLVLYHGDVGLKHVWAKGDESGLSYLLSHTVRQVLTTAHRGDTLELGLFVRSQQARRQEASVTAEADELEDPFKEASDGPLQCVVEIFHRFGVTESSNNLDTRPQPVLTTILLRRLLRKVGAVLTQDTPANDSGRGRSCRISFTLEAGAPPLDTPSAVTTSKDGLSNEPSLEQLTTFLESLKGKKINLYASSKGSFAHHLTSYLVAWGMDVSHVSPEEGVESPSDVHPQSANPVLPTEGYTPQGLPPKAEPRQPKVQPPSFIVIDDDVAVLKERLHALRPEYTNPMNLNIRKRPSLAPHHRPRSSPQVARLATPATISLPPVILHFTCLSNFKLTKDVVQSFLVSYQGTPLPVPEVMIIPKPAGPRRLLTALHSAVTKPIVDPFFSPIATTP
ncbi:hypothetical protein V5O48_016438, partial [Marasmius crinis-equi]